MSGCEHCEHCRQAALRSRTFGKDEEGCWYIEPRGDGWQLFESAGPERHPRNILHITEPDHAFANIAERICKVPEMEREIAELRAQLQSVPSTLRAEARPIETAPVRLTGEIWCQLGSYDAAQLREAAISGAPVEVDGASYLVVHERLVMDVRGNGCVFTLEPA